MSKAIDHHSSLLIERRLVPSCVELPVRDLEERLVHVLEHPGHRRLEGAQRRLGPLRVAAECDLQLGKGVLEPAPLPAETGADK